MAKTLDKTTRSGARFTQPLAALQDIAADVLKHAREHGASACEVDASEGYGQTVTVRKNEVENIEYNRDKGVSVTVYVGKKKGHASSSDYSPQAIRDTVDKALTIARFTAEDDCAGLADAEKYHQHNEYAQRNQEATVHAAAPCFLREVR